MEYTRHESENGYPEVSLAYTSLDKTIRLSQKIVLDRLAPEVPILEDKLAKIFETVSDGKKYLDLGIPRQWTGVETITFNNKKFTSNVQSLPYDHILYWGDLKEHGLEIFKTQPILHNQFSPAGKDFVGFDELRKSSMTRQKVGLNLPSPTTDWFLQNWYKFDPVCYNYDNLVKQVLGVFQNNRNFKKYFHEYYFTRDNIEKVASEQIASTAPNLKNRISQLVNSIKQIPTGFLQPSLLPKYIESGDTALRGNHGIDIFFLPNEDRLVRAPVKIGIDGKINKAKPDFRKSKEAEPADWFIMAPEIQVFLVEPLKKMRNWRPE